MTTLKLTNAEARAVLKLLKGECTCPVLAAAHDKLESAVETNKGTMSKQTKKTNIEFLTEFMTFNPAGALAQAFILEAVSQYANKIVAHEAKVREDMQNSFVNPEAWIAIAKNWQTRYSNQYEK